jgi:hypothetical protein
LKIQGFKDSRIRIKQQAPKMEGLDSRYKGVLTEEQHALLGELYTATFPPAGSGSERPALQSYIANPSASIPLSGYDHNYDLDSTSDPASPPSESSSSNILIYALPDGIGNWPQRLLHVPSMTSFEWEPGNRYGVHIAPLYNALSYTWGRYDIDNAFSEKKVNKRVLRQTKALPIRFEGRPREATEVGWAKEVPRIDPEHFTVSEFGNVIRQVCESDESAKVEFLWVDVACIDQRDGPQKDAEIGRQAVLFRGAKAVFIWLTRLRSVELNGILRELSEGTGRFSIHLH